MKDLTAEQLLENLEKFYSLINKYITGDRKDQLLDMYKSIEGTLTTSPASTKISFHNAFVGGYIDHVNRVVDAALKLDDVWREFGMADTYTTEELVFSALNHDLGKFGDEQNASYIEQTDSWRRDKLNETYMFNDRLEYMTVPDRGLYLLMSNNIIPTKNEMIAIKTHDGLYEESNKAYLMGFTPETKPRTSLLYVLHQADLLAARVEFEKEWLPKLLGEKKVEEKLEETEAYKDKYDELKSKNKHFQLILCNCHEKINSSIIEFGCKRKMKTKMMLLLKCAFSFCNSESTARQRTSGVTESANAGVLTPRSGLYWPLALEYSAVTVMLPFSLAWPQVAQKRRSPTSFVVVLP